MFSDRLGGRFAPAEYLCSRAVVSCGPEWLAKKSWQHCLGPGQPPCKPGSGNQQPLVLLTCLELPLAVIGGTSKIRLRREALGLDTRKHEIEELTVVSSVACVRVARLCVCV